MSNVAILPALAILAGTVAGAMFPTADVRAAIVLLLGAWTSAIAAHVRCRDALVKPAVCVAFAGCGFVSCSTTHEAALAPSLRVRLDEAHVLDDRRDPALVILEGRLRSDASPGPSGVRLSLDVSSVSVDGRTDSVNGGVLVSVNGDLARLTAADWTAGRRVRVPALVRRPARYLDPGVPDQEVSLARRETALVGTAKSAAVVEVIARGYLWDEWAAAVRARTRRSIGAYVGVWSPTSAAIVTALLIGDRAGLDEDVERRLQEAGTYHVIAISGGNIALLAGGMAALLVILRIRDRRAAIVPILALAAYAFIVGGGASVIRATAMALVYLAARIGDHRASPLNALGVAAAIILSASPLAIFDAGFVLTFGATLAILLGARIAGPWLPRPLVPRLAAGLLAASVSAEVALFPVSAYAFSRVTFAGLLLNFAAIPLMAVAQLAGLATLGCAAVSPSAARAAGFLAHLGASGVVGSAGAVSFAPWVTYRVPPPPLLIVGAYYAALIACLVMPRRRRAAGVVATAAALGILISPATMIGTGAAGTLDVTFFDVGQGDAALVGFPNGRSLLVDAGGVAFGGGFDIAERVLMPALWAHHIRRLTYLALTHGDPDHIGGASSIVREFRPGEIWYGTPVPPHGPTRDVKREASAVGASWRTLIRGDSLEIGGVRLRVWHPPAPDWERQRVRNDDSLVIELVFGDVSILLTGDIGRDVERELAPQLTPSRLRVVKVAHHGSATSSSAGFIAAVRPAAAVISCGRNNRYGHPVPAVLARYREAGAEIFRTDEDGAVFLKTDGRSVEVKTYTGRRWGSQD